MFTGLQNNTLSRSKLNYESGTVKNVHYGDVLIKFGDYIDASKEELPFINDDSKVEKFKGSFLHNGDIIIADTAEDETVGKCTEIQGVDDIKLISGLHTIPCRPKEEYGAKFLGYYMNSSAYRAQLIPLMQGIKVTSISKSALQDTDMIIPKSVDEQTIIGEYFSNLDNLITLHQRKSFFKTFKIIVWEQRKLGDIVGNTYGGGTPKTNVEEYWNGEIPWIQSSNVAEDEMFDIDISKKISEQGLAKSAAKLVPKNSIAVVTHVGVGKLVFMPFPYTTSQDFTSLAELKTDAQFTCYSLYRRLKNDLHVVQGSAIKGITKEDLLCKELMLPSIEEQKKIGECFRNLDHLITLHRRAYHHHKRRTYK